MEAIDKTTFGKLSADAAYSAYHDAVAFGTNHQDANADYEKRVTQAEADVQAARDDKVKALAESEATAKKAADDVAVQHQQQVGALSAAVAERDAAIKQHLAMIDAMGGTELGQKLARQRQRDAALSAKTQAEAILAALPEEV